MTVEFRYAERGDYPGISRFLDTYWAKDHAYVRFPQLFDWTFGRRNLWGHDGYSFALAEDKSEIVGILGGIPFVFNCLGNTSEGVWTANYMVRPDYRRGVTAIRLLAMFRSHFRATVAFGNNAEVTPLYRALRARLLVDMPRHFMVLPGAVGRMANLLRVTYPDWSGQRAEDLAHAFSRIDIPQTSIQPSNVLPVTWDAQDWPRIALRTIGAARDLDYLTWRYREHPCFQYRFLTVPEGERTGLAIWRLETIRRSTLQGLVEVDRIGRLVEFLPASRDNAQVLLALFWHALADADAIGADYYNYHGESRVWLQEFGFLATNSHLDGQAIPSRFQPLESKGGRILSAVFAPDTVPMCSEDLQCNWYWSKSDSDQDRPN
jgi:hypothetical protein